MIEKSRRQFVQIFPLVGLGLLAACGDKKPAAVAAAPAPAPAPAPVAAAPAPVAAAPAAATAPAAPAANLPMVAADDATAVSLGYNSDETKVDKAKYAQHVAGTKCGNCSLYQGAAGSAAAAVHCSPANMSALTAGAARTSKKRRNSPHQPPVGTKKE